MKPPLSSAAGRIIPMVLPILLAVTACDSPERLEHAINEGQAATVAILLEEHPNWVNFHGDFNSTPLHVAAAQGNLEIVQLLLAHGADVTTRTFDGWSPLHSAAWRGRTAVASLLIAGGADVAAASQKGDTPLHQAAGSGHVALVRLLLEHGADVNVPDGRRATPLHHAAADCHATTARVLLEAGADVNLVDDLRRSPLHTVAASSCETIISSLVDEQQVSDAGEVRDQFYIVDLFVEHGANLNAIDAHGLTPLSLANIKKNKPMIEKLRRLAEDAHGKSSAARPGPRMNTADFDYDLPPELIAQRPLPDRTASRMLVVDRERGTISHDQVANLGTLLAANDLLVLNDTKVCPARLWPESPAVELLLVENLGANRWSALARPGRKLKPGVSISFRDTRLTATVETITESGERVLQFNAPVEPYLQTHGSAPLPPYIKRDRDADRDDRAQDLERYQTVYARAPGAIAAPTAGLHFTPALLDDLAGHGIPHTFLTLHVGIGTFRPVKTDTIEEHRMHSERFEVSEAAAEAMQQAGRLIAVGTTVARTLETVGAPRAAAGETEIFIHPPYSFRVVDVLLTNFHLPRSTLLMLVSAFAGRELILEAYRQAVEQKYRFYSYGDCMLIL